MRPHAIPDARDRAHDQQQEQEGETMQKSLIAAVAAGLWIAAASSAFAQSSQGASQGAKLPPDIDPVSLTRLPHLTRADLDADGQAIYDRMIGKDEPAPKTGPRAVMLYSPKASVPVDELNGFLRYNGALSPRHTEVAICVAAWEIEQQYEYSAHEPAALRFGAPQAVIDTIKFNREPVGLSPEETLIIKFGRQLLREHKLDSELFAESVKLFGRQGTVELALVMGDYVMMGMVLTAIDQHLPPDRPALLPPR
jgi:hypothetical protein